MIKAQNIHLKIERNVILEDVSFEIKKGQYIGLIGPNGAGKTSLIKIILGLYKATQGSITISPHTKIGYVPQSYALSNVIPISVTEVLTMSGITKKNILEENLTKVGLSKIFLTKNFHHLSGGQKQRVIIARALCQNPNFLIFDEPLNGIDFETKITIYDLLATLNQKEKISILFVSHEIDQIINKCHHILCLNRTMHTQCHPINLTKEKTQKSPPLKTITKLNPIHHHHDKKSTCPY